jgi:glycine hydroxymethyltransferase
MLADMAHISGLVAAQLIPSPFDTADIVTTTTHKSLRGPRAGMIFYRKDARGFGPKIDQAVFPALQGGPHEHQIAGVATQLREVMTPGFKVYVQQVKKNMACLAAALIAKGFTIATGGTDNHLLLWDLRPLNLTGSKFEKVCDKCHITLNKNCVPGDRSAASPGGVRIGAPALTTRGFKEADFEKIATILQSTVVLALKIQESSGKMLKDFVAALEHNAEADAIAAEVFALATSFPMPGFEVADLKYKTATH